MDNYKCIHILVKEAALVKQLLNAFALSSLKPHCELGNFKHKEGGMQLLQNLGGYLFCVHARGSDYL